MTKSTITRERLEQLADNNTICKVSWDERIELAQIVLAAMDSEPVAVVRYVDAGFKRPGIHVSVYDTSLPDGTELFTSPQPAPVVLDDGKLRELFDAWFASDCSFDLSPEASEADNIAWRESYWYVWKRCRAAMLQELQKSAGAEATCRSNENVQVLHTKSPANPGCWCRTCRPVAINDMRFVVCPHCGNKRCPQANDHRNACTGSNEPGQEGSAYPAGPKEVK